MTTSALFLTGLEIEQSSVLGEDLRRKAKDHPWLQRELSRIEVVQDAVEQTRQILALYASFLLQRVPSHRIPPGRGFGRGNPKSHSSGKHRKK